MLSFVHFLYRHSCIGPIKYVGTKQKQENARMLDNKYCINYMSTHHL